MKHLLAHPYYHLEYPLNDTLRITSKPLTGLRALRPKMRIVIWDHMYANAFFIGDVTQILSAHEGLARSLVESPKKNVKLFDVLKFNFEKSGLVPVSGTTDLFNPRYRVYELPFEASPENLTKFKFHVDHKLPDEKATRQRFEQNNRRILSRVTFEEL